MRFTNLHIDGFGVLTDLPLPELLPGLNVVHGTNGSGKTTILHFLRGVLCGFADARRLRLLPPLKGGTPGGSVGLIYKEAHYKAIRHPRPDKLDALAINHTLGRTEDVPGLRKTIESIDRELFFTLFAVGNYESHAIEPLVRLAQRDGISLKGTVQSASWISSKIDQAKAEREDLFHGPPARGKIQELERQHAALQGDVSKLSHSLQSEQDQWAISVRQLREQLARLQEEINWLHVELQQTQSDLTEVHDRLWSRRRETVRESHVVEKPGPARPAAWIEELHALDAQIVHHQQVLKDLAASRLQVTVHTAGFAGVERPEVETYFARHRSAIAALEAQAQRLSQMEQSLSQSSTGNSCVCRSLQGQVRETLESIRQQVYFICQELSRQQAVHQQFLLQAQRESIDTCEVEVIRQIQRLRIRRDELLHRSERTPGETLQHRTLHDAAHCECQHHSGFVAGLPHSCEAGIPVQETVYTDRFIDVSAARPGDAEWAERLLLRRAQLQKQWWAAQQKWCAGQQELERLLAAPQRFAADTSLQQKRYEFAVVEQQLADAREQWQSLALLQQVLKSTQEKLHVEQAAPVIEEASRLLRRLTEGRYHAFVFDAAGNQLLVQAESGEKLSLAALSRGTLDQAALAFRLALWHEYLRRGTQLPLLLDDVLNDSDEDRLRIAAEILVEYGQHQQILFFTCQEHLANVFESLGVSVRDLPGSTRTRPTVVRTPHIAPALERVTRQHAEPELVWSTPEVAAESTEPPFLTQSQNDEHYSPLQRTQPDEPYWLQADSPVMNVPSLSAQMARRLGALGVRHVADLVDLDPESTEIPLDSLQISAGTLRNWQAECRLLCCIPELNGRDAQVLVAVGLMSPAELAEANLDDLAARIDRLRYHAGEHLALTWLHQAPQWPGRDVLQRWTRNAQRARSFRSAREWAATRRGFRSRRDRDGVATRTGSTSARSTRTNHDDHDRTERERTEREPRAARTALVERESTPRMSLVARPSAETAREYRFFLNLDSPVVDAPSIGPKMASRLEKLGVSLISDLLHRDAGSIATKLADNRVTAEDILTWQQQAMLMTAIPEMRGHDVQVLVAVGITDPQRIASATPEALFAQIGPFVSSKEGQRLLRSSKTPDLDEIREWIEYAQHARSLKAA